MQNRSNNFDPLEQKLREVVEPVEMSDRLPPQPEWIGTHSVKTLSVRPAQTITNTDINAEPSSVQISEGLTIMQVPSPLPEAEAGNSETILQRLPNPRLQDSPPSVVLVNHVSLSPQKSGEVERSGASSQPNRTVEAVRLTPNPIAQFSSQDDSKNLNDARIAVFQNRVNTIIQYSDSAIHNPADQTVCQTTMPSSINLDQTVCQLRIPQSPQSSTLATMPKNWVPIELFHPSIFRDMFRASGSFTSRFVSIIAQFFHSIGRKIDPKQLQSRFHTGRQQVVLKTSAQPSSSSINRSPHNVMASEDRLPSSDQYQKKLLELDLCRLAFAKELARNGKFRNAIAMAEQISETSQFFKDAQMLIQSWK